MVDIKKIANSVEVIKHNGSYMVAIEDDYQDIDLNNLTKEQADQLLVLAEIVALAGIEAEDRQRREWEECTIG
jgi:nitrate reductase assembly molybdenum cofactor insertion protein NarJ